MNNGANNPDQSKEERENAYRKALSETESERISDEQGEVAEQVEIDAKKATPPGLFSDRNLGKVKTDFELKAELHEENKKLLSNVGWRKVDIANLPSEGKYNDASMKITIRPATVEEIKHYSGLDDTDLLDVSEHINEIITKCCRINYATRAGSYNDLKEADKYYIFFCIRDLTMDDQQKYNKLWQDTICPKCGKKSHGEITSKAFSVYQIPKNILKYYDSEKRKIVIADSTFDEPLMISPPSLGLTSAIQKYMQDHARKQQAAGATIYFDPKFMMRLQYILDEPSQVNEAYLKNLQKKMGAWAAEKLIAFEYIRENMDVGVRPHLETICRDTESTNSEVSGCVDDYSFSTPVAFRFGWRSIFDLSGIVERLFDSDPE